MHALAWTLSLLLLGCSGQSAREADRAYTAGRASVESLVVTPKPGRPSHVEVIARGYLPDSCTRIDSEQRERFGQRIQVTLTTRREAGAICAQVLQPFTRTILIPLADLPDGLYTVEVNGVSRAFDVHHEFRRHDVE